MSLEHSRKAAYNVKRTLPAHFVVTLSSAVSKGTVSCVCMYKALRCKAALSLAMLATADQCEAISNTLASVSIAISVLCAIECISL
jgi:hypothetical protein